MFFSKKYSWHDVYPLVFVYLKIHGIVRKLFFFLILTTPNRFQSIYCGTGRVQNGYRFKVNGYSSEPMQYLLWFLKIMKINPLIELDSASILLKSASILEPLSVVLVSKCLLQKQVFLSKQELNVHKKALMQKSSRIQLRKKAYCAVLLDWVS